jgi:hypothetical protein
MLMGFKNRNPPLRQYFPLERTCRMVFKNRNPLLRQYFPQEATRRIFSSAGRTESYRG